MTRRARCFALTLAAALAGAASAKVSDPALDGTAWKLLMEGERVPEGLAVSDMLVFRAGRFADLEGLDLGFRPSSYVVETENGRERWWATLPRPDGSIASWSGTREGRRMTGVLRWTLATGQVLELRWRAFLRPLPVAAPEL